MAEIRGTWDEGYSVRANLLHRVQHYQWVSFAELANSAPEHFFEGDLSYGFPDKNLFFWCGLSQEAVNALNDLRAQNLIKFDPTSCFVYYCDGRVLNMPIANRPPRNGYKKPHWMIVVINPVGADSTR